MPYKFTPNTMYQMPTHFGPSTGPRQGKGGSKFENVDTPQWTEVGVSFVGNREQLDGLLPHGFGLSVGAEPIVTVAAAYATGIEWLAGRGYNTFGVQFSAVFDGKEDRRKGSFLTVLWENMCEPILTGREELGFSKIFCELPGPRFHRGGVHCIASWMGFKFADLRLENLVQVPVEEAVATMGGGEGDGLLHFKYMPKTGEWGTPEVSYVTLTPAEGVHGRIQEAWLGEGTVEFHEATWEDMPTQFHIVNGIRNLEIAAYRAAWVFKGVGGTDLSDQRILR